MDMPTEMQQHQFAFQGTLSSHAKLKDSIAREAREIVTYGSTDDINN